MDPRSQVCSVLAAVALRGDGPSLGGVMVHQRLDADDHVRMDVDGTPGELEHIEGAFTCDGVAADTYLRVRRGHNTQIYQLQVKSAEVLCGGR